MHATDLRAQHNAMWRVSLERRVEGVDRAQNGEHRGDAEENEVRSLRETFALCCKYDHGSEDRSQNARVESQKCAKEAHHTLEAREGHGHAQDSDSDRKRER